MDLLNIVRILINPNVFLQVFIAIILLNINIITGKLVLLKEGLNQIFLKRISPYSIKVSIIIFFILIYLTWIKDKGKISLKKTYEKIEIRDFLY